MHVGKSFIKSGYRRTLNLADFVIACAVENDLEQSSTFLTCDSHTAHVIAIGWTFVLPSVCPSHAGIVSKRLNLSSNCLHCLVAP